MKTILRFFDVLEDRIRGKLSRYPMLYALLAGTAIVLFWRGVWHLADELNLSSIHSLLISVAVMTSTGLFVSFFIGDNIILAGIKREKKLIEKTEDEVLKETSSITEIHQELKALRKDLREIKKRLS